MTFFLSFHCIAQRVNLELVVADYDRIGSSDPIGKVLLGYNRKGLELKHWKEMIENPRRPIVHWHVLKDPEPGDEECGFIRKSNISEKDLRTNFFFCLAIYNSQCVCAGMDKKAGPRLRDPRSRVLATTLPISAFTDASVG